ncbi:MAG: rhomboid family intramembrane serine protease [Candidatus Rifleibacteriota bacterium]
MFPIKDDLQPKRIPYITWLLLGLNILVFIVQLGLPRYLLETFYHLYGIVPARIMHPDWASAVGFPAGAIITLLTSMFIHGGWLHIIGNSWMLWLFGDDVEDRIGHGNFLLLYFLSGIVAGITQIALHPDSTIPTIGASGAIAGVMGAYFLLFPRASLYVLVPIFFFIDIWKIPAALFLPIWFIGELFSGTVALITPGFSNIAFWAHIGGFIAGASILRSILQLESIYNGQSINPQPQSVRRPNFVMHRRNPYQNLKF